MLLETGQRVPTGMQARFAACLAVLLPAICVEAAETDFHETVVIGAGPAGVQLGYFLEKAGRDYTVLERNTVPGSFYLNNPRHRQLISINKFNTGSGNPEFNLRHDWNSLLDDNQGFTFPQKYSSDFFPNADTLVEYLADYTEHYKIKVEYNTDVTLVEKDASDFYETFFIQYWTNKRNIIC